MIPRREGGIISIHALREEGDLLFMTGFSKTMQFLSTPSARRATPEARPRHPARWISIHALREEGDLVQRSGNPNRIDFYPRPPRGGRPQIAFFKAAGSLFLSTPSARRATRFLLCLPLVKLYFYPRPPRGGRLPSRCHSQRPFCISIHALREEGDRRCAAACGDAGNFYPRPPRGGRPFCIKPACRVWRISIHALREEGDPGCHDHCERYAEFLSTPSARRATTCASLVPTSRPFLSTPSARRATCQHK